MHLTSRWHQEAGGSLGRPGDGVSILGTSNSLLLPHSGQRTPCPRGSESGNNGPSSHGEIGQGQEFRHKCLSHLVAADQSWCLHTLSGPAQGSN